MPNNKKVTFDAPASFIQACLKRKVKTSTKGTVLAKSDGGGFLSNGSRNTDLASAAGWLIHRGLDPKNLESALIGLNSSLAIGLDISEVTLIANSIGNYGDSFSTEGFNHDSFAKLFVSEYSPIFSYCVGRGFYLYENGRWVLDAEGLKTLQKVRELTDKIMAWVKGQSAVLSSQDIDKLHKAAAKIKSTDFMKKSMALIKSDPLTTHTFSDYDKQSFLINFKNGTYNLHTDILSPHSSLDLLTTMIDVDFDALAVSPDFNKFMHDILPEDKVSFMQRLFGYALMGTGKEQMFFIFHGAGKNGKSTLVEIMDSIFGDFTVTMQPESLSGKLDGQIRNDIARLATKRLMLTSETRAGSLLDAPLMKQITGQDTLTARFLHKEFFQFKPVCVPIITSNHLPVIDGSDYAMERRTCVLSFERKIEVVDKTLSAKLEREKAGIVNWILKGAAEYQGGGLQIPESVRLRTRAFIDNSNLIKSFMQDSLTVDDNAKVGAANLYERYRMWSNDNGYKPMSISQFKQKFQSETGYSPNRDKDGVYWAGVALKMHDVGISHL